MKKNIYLLSLFVNVMFSQTWVQLNNIGAVITGTSTSAVPFKEALCFSVNSKIYVIGAVTPSSITPNAMVWEYDPALDSWKEKTSYPGAANIKMAGFCIGNFIYVGTGLNNSSSMVLLSDFYRYNTATNTWSAIANFPSAREGATGFSIGSKGYVCCGSISYTSNPTDLWAYDTTLNVWQQKANFPGPHRIGASSFSALNNGYVGLGYSYSVSVWNSDFYKYDPINDAWSATAAFPGQGRLRAGAVSIQDNGIVLWGNNGMPVLNDAYIYSASTNSWSSYVSFAGTPRSNILFGTFGNKIFAGGGNGVGGGGVNVDWWSLQTTVGINKVNEGNETIMVRQLGEGKLSIKATEAVSVPMVYKICNIEGKLIYKGLLTEEKIVQMPSPGMYFIVFERTDFKPMKFAVY